jgi:hypothetical protein
MMWVLLRCADVASSISIMQTIDGRNCEHIFVEPIADHRHFLDEFTEG